MVDTKCRLQDVKKCTQTVLLLDIKITKLNLKINYAGWLTDKTHSAE